MNPGDDRKIKSDILIIELKTNRSIKKKDQRPSRLNFYINQRLFEDY